MSSNSTLPSFSLAFRDFVPRPGTIPSLSFDSECSSDDFTDMSSLEYNTEGGQSPKTSVDEFVQEKAATLQHIMRKILATKEAFLKQYSHTNEVIEETARNIFYTVQEKEQELKTKLQEMGNSRILAWNRQLMTCTEALMWLNNDSLVKEEDMVETWRCFERMLDFIDVGRLSFERGRGPFLKNFGKLICREEILSFGGKSDASVTTAPEFIIGAQKPGGLCRLWGVCSDPMGRILVSDRHTNNIQVFTGSGAFMFEFGEEGAKEGQFCRPAGIAVDKSCRIIVADKDNHRIQVFTYNGKFIFGFGKSGTGAGEFAYPWGVAVNGNFEIAVADSKNWRVQLFDKNGVYLTHMSSKLEVGNPRDLAFKPDGGLLVTDFYNHKILIIDKKFKKVRAFGKAGSKPKEFLRPQGIACDRNGRFAVADSRNNRVQVFDDRGRLIKIFGGSGNKPGELNSPQGVAFLPDGRLIVADFGNKRVQVFSSRSQDNSATVSPSPARPHFD